MRITMEEILTRNGMPLDLLHHPRVTKALASEMVKRGFRKTQISVGGERRNYWTDEDNLLDIDPAAMVAKALSKEI